MDRYFIDERGGCIAVRDREDTNPDDHGLHPETQGVVKYWHGEPTTQKGRACRHGSLGGWVVLEYDKAEAERICDSLNSIRRKAAAYKTVTVAGEKEGERWVIS